MESKVNISWRGVDGAGFQYGFYREGDKQYRVDIAVPGPGDNAKHGPHKVYVQGEEIGASATLRGAEALAGEFFSLRGHDYIEREEPGAKRALGAVFHTLAARFKGEARGPAPEPVTLAPLPGPEPRGELFGGFCSGKKGRGR